MKYSVQSKIFLLVESWSWFDETEISEEILMLYLWHKFKLAEITQIVRQKGDTVFIELLNKITVRAADISVDYILKSRIV